MDDGGLTRRSLLAAMAGAGAASLFGPRPALATLAAALRPVVFDAFVGSVGPAGHTLRAPRRFDLVGVQWAGPPEARVRLRAATRVRLRAAMVPAMLRAMFVFHRDVKGWKDIGYNFVIDRFGRIWEARRGGIDEPVVGAQAGGYNVVSTGVAVLGSFMAQTISPAARLALTHLLAWKLSLHGVPVIGVSPPVEVLVAPARPPAGLA